MAHATERGGIETPSRVAGGQGDGDRRGTRTREGQPMPGIVEWPTVVQQGLEQFGSLFENDCQRQHFAEYVCGLIGGIE